MATRQPAPVKNFNDLPVTLTIDDLAAIYRLSTKTIRRQLYAGTFCPLPFRKFPYLWRRDDVIREYNAPTRKLATRKPQGFAVTRARARLAETASR